MIESSKLNMRQTAVGPGVKNGIIRTKNYFFKNGINTIWKNIFTYFSSFDVLEAQYLDSISKT